MATDDFLRHLLRGEALRPRSRVALVRAHLQTYPGEVCLSELARTELLGVFHRRLREGSWTPADFSAAARQFQQDDLAGFWTWLPLDAVITQATAQLYLTLPPGVFLRTADGLHLATACHHGFAEIFTFDRHQTLAAPSLGLRPRDKP